MAVNALLDYLKGGGSTSSNSVAQRLNLGGSSGTVKPKAAPFKKTPTPKKTQSSVDDAMSIFKDITSSGVASIAKDVGQFGADTITSIGSNIRDALSGKDYATIFSGTPLGDAFKKSVESGKGITLGHPYTPADLKQMNPEMSKGSFWDRLGSAINVVSTPLILKDVIEAPIKIGAKSLLGKSFEDPITTALKDFSGKIITGGKQVAAKFGEIDPASYRQHFDAAKMVFPNLKGSDLLTQQGRHVMDWVTKQAEKITEKGGGDIGVTRSAIIQAWSEAPRIWHADTIEGISKALNNHAVNLDKTRSILSTVFGHLGLDDQMISDVVLYTKDYATKNRVMATLNGKGSSLVTDYMENLKVDYPKGDPGRKMLNTAISQVKEFEKGIGHKLGFGHESFVFPTTLDQVPQTIDKIPQDLAPVINGDLSKFKQFTDTIKAIANPQIYTDDAKQALRDSQFRAQLVEKGLSPQDIFDRIGHLRARGLDISLNKMSTKDLENAFGENAQAVKDAISGAKNLPIKITGLTTSGLVSRIPGVGQTLVNAVYGLRWKVSPLFQLVKIPTKLWEVGAAAGITPWSDETSKAVTNYVMNNNSSWLRRVMTDQMLELQYQAKSIYGEVSQRWVNASDNVVSKAASNLVDHIMNADQRVYMKAAYKKLSDLGYDLSKVPKENQLDFMKKVPVNVIGQVDNYAKSLTKYGQGTSPLENTVNTVLFPAMFHYKIAKFAIAGALSFPLAAKTITSMIELGNQWAMSTQGQKWHQTTGIGQTLLHEIGYAEPINISTMTGRDVSPGQQASQFYNPYNPFSPLLQGIRDLTGAKIPTTTPPGSTAQVLDRGNVENTLKDTFFNLTGTSSEARVAGSIADWVTGKKGFQRTTKSITTQQKALQAGKMPPIKSMKTSVRDFILQQNPSQDQKQAYAEERAQFDYPDNPAKQKQEEDFIMRIFKGTHVKQSSIQ